MTAEAPASRPTGPADVSIIVVTWRRPEYVRRCLSALDAMDERPRQVIVVDASEDDATQIVVSGFASVELLPFPHGAGHMTTARNHGLEHALGSVVSFIDDDVCPRNGWLSALEEAFADAHVAAVAGRTCNAGEVDEEVDPALIGRVTPSGHLTAHFSTPAPTIVEVEHGIGANMSFRREVLMELGGFRDDFGGTALREDTDVFLRVRQLGGKVVFAPQAVVDHAPAPHVVGTRFDWRYMYWGRRNHVLLLARHYGLLSPTLRRWIAAELTAVRSADGRRSRRLIRICMAVAAIGSGLAYAVGKADLRRPRDPVRRDDLGRRLAARAVSMSPVAGGKPSRSS